MGRLRKKPSSFIFTNCPGAVISEQSPARILRVHKHKIGVPFPVPSVLASARMRRRFSRCKVCSAVYGDVLATIVSADTFFLFRIVSAVLEQRVQEYRFSSRYRLDNRTVRSDMLNEMSYHF